jgi:S-adenosylmethionine-diacylglycerol 3-amino-3-carboxypropyl transferase
MFNFAKSKPDSRIEELLMTEQATGGTILKRAVTQNNALSRAGFSERLFAWLFKGLVYPQIWEDPEVDMAALAIEPGHRIVTIASGGCNALSYLTADPARIEAVDLNQAHVAFNRLKLAALKHLPDYQAFYRFYGKADDKTNLAAYKRFIRPHLDSESRAYWEKRKWNGRQRISIFWRDLYRHGLLGVFIGMGHRVARLYGIDPRDILKARTMEEQRSFFDAALAPLFEKRMVRWATARKSSLFGLGIPPQQYDALATAGNGDMALVLCSRLEKLACGFPLADNYFAWQAFGRGYGGDEETGPLPPYLSRGNFETVRARADRLTVQNASYTDFLAAKPAASVDRYILLDAQDWMSDGQLNALWSEITRTAAPNARVIFRTAAEPSLLPGRVAPEILDRWTYQADQSRALHDRDRSSIYGGFHLYILKDA